MHEKCIKSWNKMQKEGQKGLTGFERQKPCKNSGGTLQKIFGGALAKSEREERLKNFLKKSFWKRQSDLLKNMFHKFRSIKKQPRSIETNRDSIKTIWKEFDRSKQTEALSNIFKNFRSIEKQNGSIEMGRDSLNLRKNTVFWKTFWINSKHWNLRTKCMSMWWYDFQNKNFKPKFPKTKFLAFSTNFQATN